MVQRLLLVCPCFGAVDDLVAEVRRRDLLAQVQASAPLGSGTVLRALAAMEREHVVTRQQGVRLLRTDALLERLVRNYRAPGCAEPARFELPARPPGLYQFLARQAAAMRTVVVATGLSSEVRYASVQPGDMLRVYCPPGADFIACLGQMRCERFANLEVVETADPSVYFDARQDEGGFWWASPVQTYLELMAGDKRDQETASQVHAGIVAGLGEAAQAEPAQSR